jgi:hypothetical protein
MFSRVVFFITPALFAGSTGKISGRIIDASSLMPLQGANVVVEGTFLGAATDDKGDYVILNVPPGLFTLQITMIGYKRTVMQQVRVSVDLTTKIHAALNPTVLTADESVTVVAERPLVQPDMTGSLASVGADEIQNLPVQSLNDVLEIQAGVVRDGDDFHVRGGRAGEVAYWVDGVATTDVFGGGNANPVEKNVIQELQVVSGTFNAEYGQAMSGIVNIITKEGGRKTAGNATAYIGDYASGHDVYTVLKKVGTSVDPVRGTVSEIEDRDNPLSRFNPVADGDFTLSGPVPGLGDRFSFFANGRYFSDEGYLYGRRWYLPQGLRGDSSLVPLRPYASYSGMGKLTCRMSNLKFNYSLYLNDWNMDRSTGHAFKYTPDAGLQVKGSGITQILAWNHVLSPNFFYEARVSRLYRENESYVYEDPYMTPHWMVYVPGDSLTGSFTLDLDTDEGKTRLEELKRDKIPLEYYIDPSDPQGYVHPDSLRDPAAYSFYRAGMSRDHYFQSTAYWVGKLDFTGQINAVHQMKAGFEFRLHDLALNTFTLQANRYSDRDEEIVPFEPWVPPVSNIYHDQYNRKPVEASAYIQDKVELKHMIVNIGLRFDYFNSRSVIPRDPGDPNIYDPFLAGNRYRNPEAADSLRIPYTPDERRAFMHQKADSKTQISPRLGIAYPITDRGIIHFSYGHFFSMPGFQHLYDSPDFKLYSGGGRTIVGNADLDAERTVMYEIGLQQQITDNVALDVTLFYRDVRDWVGTSPLIITEKPGVAYSRYENKDYSNVRGITLDLKKRYSGRFSANVYYMFQVAEGSYSNPDDAFFALQAEQEPRLALIPLNWDQRHTLNSVVTGSYRGWTATLMGKLQTGRPYTPSFGRGSRVGTTAYVGYRDNSSRLPTTSSLDLRIQKQIRVGGMTAAFFATLYNLFDQKGEVWVYTETGTARYSTNISPDYAGYDPARVGTVRDLVRQPDWYISPRQIQAGVQVTF